MTTTVAKTKEEWKEYKQDPRTSAMVKKYDGLPNLGSFNPAVTDSVFNSITHYCLGRSEEVAGLAVYQDGQITWAMVDEQDPRKGAANSVSSSTGHIVASALAAGYPPPNVQWHTHPGLSVFFSPTDIEDQFRTVRGAARLSDSGEYYFLVIDGLDWLAAALHWEGGKIVGKRRGRCLWRGKELRDQNRYHNWRRNRADTVATHDGDITPDGAWIDYRLLFDVMGVTPYDWTELYCVIQEIYPDQYYDILATPEWWPNL